MDLIPEDAHKLFGNGRYDSFPLIASRGDIVLAVWRSATKHDIDHDSFLRGAMSTDGGRTWKDPFVLYDDKDPLIEIGNGGVAWDEKRNVWVVMVLTEHYDSASSTNVARRGAHTITSPLLATGSSWSKLSPELPVSAAAWWYGSELAIGADGLWVAVGYGRMDPSPWGRPMTLTSRDAGKTWSPLTPVADLPSTGFSETPVIQLPSGSWLMAMRCDSDTTIHTATSDDGVTWTYAQPVLGGYSGYPELGQAGDGTLVMLLRDGSNGPDPFHGSWAWAWSQDDGESWSVRTDFPGDGKAMMYGGLAQTADGSLACVFASEDDPSQPWKSASVYWTRFVVSKLTATTSSPSS